MSDVRGGKMEVKSGAALAYSYRKYEGGHQV